MLRTTLAHEYIARLYTRRSLTFPAGLKLEEEKKLFIKLNETMRVITRAIVLEVALADSSDSIDDIAELIRAVEGDE